MKAKQANQATRQDPQRATRLQAAGGISTGGRSTVARATGGRVTGGRATAGLATAGRSMFGRSTWLIGLAAVTTLAAVSGCTLDEDKRFDPRLLGNLERQAAKENDPRPLRPLPTTLESPFLPPPGNEPRRPASKPVAEPARQPLDEGGLVVTLSLREITQRAVAQNLNVKVAGYTPAIDETRVAEAVSRFDPQIFSNISYSESETNSFTANGNRGDRADIFAGEFGLRQNLPTGGNASLSFRPQRIESKSGAPNGGDFSGYQNEISLQITQPLLRDFGLAVNRARIVINRNNQRVSILEFRRSLEDMLTQLEQTYWQLVQSKREVEIQEELLQRTIDTAEILTQRIGQDVTRVQISQANASVELRRSDLIRARQNVRDLSDQLKSLMNDPDFPITGDTLILPADAPLVAPVQFDMDELINTAFLNRYELGQQLIRVDSARIAQEVADNNLLPQLNLVASGGLQSIGEDGLYDAINGKYAPNFSVGLQFVYPIGNREARAIYVRSMLQRLQAVEQYRALLAQVSLSISQGRRAVDTGWAQIVQARKAVFAAADALESLDIRQRAQEPLTPNFVQLKLDQQDRLAQAQRLEAGAIATYNIALSRLEAAKGTLLRYNNVILDEKGTASTR